MLYTVHVWFGEVDRFLELMPEAKRILKPDGTNSDCFLIEASAEKLGQFMCSASHDYDVALVRPRQGNATGPLIMLDRQGGRFRQR